MRPANVVLVALLVVLHFTLRPLFVQWPVSPDLLTAAVLLAALFMRAGYAAILGFLLGVLEESMALSGTGWTPLLYTVAGYLGARFRDVIFADVRFFIPLYLFLATWFIHAAIAGLSGSLDPRYGLIIAPISAALTALIGALGENLVAMPSR